MEYLAKLRDTFADVPLNIILKADVLRRGIALNDDLKAAGAVSCSSGLSTKLEQLVGSADPTPGQLHFVADETTVDLKISFDTPYRIEADSEGRHFLHCGDEQFGQVRFTERPSYADLETSDGTPCAYQFIQRGPSCICVSPLDVCGFYTRGEACKFCILSPAMDMAVKMKLIKAVPDYGIMAEAVAVACKADVDLKELKLTGGALYDTRKEASYYKACLEKILERIDAPEEVTLLIQAVDREDQIDLKQLGVTNMCFDMEVWDAGLWPELLPGKTRAVGRDEWLRRLEGAVEVFGRGHVGTNFVGGFECAPRDGFLTQDQALKSYAQGFEYLIERGVVPWFTVWTAMPIGSDFRPEEPPQAEFYLKLGNILHELLEKHGVYPDLGFNEMGVDPPTLGLYCYYCYSMQFTHDYPRLIGRGGVA